MKGKTTYLIDGDILVYKSASAAEQVFNWGDGDDAPMSYYAEFTKAVDALTHMLDRVAPNDGYKVIALSDPADNWRHEILPTYKGNRAGNRRPLLWARVREFILEHYTVYQRPSLEADDVLGILMTSTKIIPGSKICVSDDKDMLTVPGVHYIPRKKETIRISEVEAARNHIKQTLTGDVVDGYSGCPGVGEVATRRFLEHPFRWMQDGEGKWRRLDTDDVWAGVVSLFERRGLTEEDALTQARVARILHNTDYDFTNKRPIPWTPENLESLLK